MKLKPIVPLMSLIFAATLTGCNFDGSSDDSNNSSTDSGSGETVPTQSTSPLADSFWNISGNNTTTLSGVTTYSTDLPNVYVFNGETQYYYDDDTSFGTYVVTETPITEDIESQTLSFTYYDASGATPIDGTYSVTSGALTIETGAFGTLTGTDESANTAVTDAVTTANEDAGIVIGSGETFDEYTTGTNISEANSVWVEYNTILTDGLPSTATVSSDFANSGSNSLLIQDLDSSNKPFVTREFSAGSSTSGSISFDVYIPSSNEKTTYINVGTGKNNSDRYFELRLSGSGKVEVESGDSDKEIGAITNDEWNSLSLAWDGDNITITINNEKVTMTQSETGLTATNTPSQLTLYTGDTSGDANKAYFDNISSDLF
ncbi:hypothetical protein [Vibrio sp. E150_018]